MWWLTSGSPGFSERAGEALDTSEARRPTQNGLRHNRVIRQVERRRAGERSMDLIPRDSVVEKIVEQARPSSGYPSRTRTTGR